MGFSGRYKVAAGWKRRVESLRDNTPRKVMNEVMREGVVVGDLLMLGLEYLNTKGRESNYSMYINNEFRRALNLK
jgi:hypothetical protein